MPYRDASFFRTALPASALNVAFDSASIINGINAWFATDGADAFDGIWPVRFGGNMDAADVREGTTVYLPVFHDGALFYFGDGHAVQGDGEVCGSCL